MDRPKRSIRAVILVVALLVAVFPLLNACSAPNGQAAPSPDTSTSQAASELKGKITISGAWALYPMMVKWAEEFQKIYPDVRVEVSAGGAGKGAADALGGLVDIGMVSREIYPAEIEKGGVYVACVIDAVVATVNAGNPVKEDILARGLKRQSFVDIWITGNITNWKDIFPETKAFGKTELHVLTRSDACGAGETWAKYLDKKQEDLLGIGVYGDPGIAETVSRDSLAIGYDNIGYAYDIKSRNQLEGLLVVPIDVNENGKVDPEENFYGTLDEINQAIATGIYPSPPARELNLLTVGEFKGVTKEFVRWILTKGQQYAPESGYIPLSKTRVQQELEKIR